MLKDEFLSWEKINDTYKKIVYVCSLHRKYGGNEAISKMCKTELDLLVKELPEKEQATFWERMNENFDDLGSEK